ncbi:uncharacterized protein CANTADRAFT_6971 [Suhomyces tanzawaensis NRRL Y-17324]|uniref:Ribosomal protein mS38 C-terminal domain-containing protein n=1 Tax=Suhomyces tanzawaensis NRRL Y-17324 TaxID=984487 RepID=A0A1E4SGH2_9ASCO|nr:uncharacterized protein CANTADRAFT_6971 [Suhomyces tanzawaensis NRRL Y-17324]ODV78617.1 hypothetical protein CANTADRAFT_6971 [Suhomyces tanzawaensis NRRL Y-17324]
MFGARTMMQRLPFTALRMLSSVARVPRFTAAPLAARLFPSSVTVTTPHTMVSHIQPELSILDKLPMNAFEEPVVEEDKTMYMDSVLRKRRLKMKKHKLRKRRREQRSLMKRLGKI